MKIKIDLSLLDVQIQECDIKADNASTEEERGIFEGVANLLSAIGVATEQGEEVCFEMER